MSPRLAFADGDVFIGRRAELAFLAACADAACRGESRFVLIDGPAGVGKSALVRRFLSHRDDLTVLRAAGVEDESVIGYGVLDQLVSAAPAGAPEALNVMVPCGGPDRDGGPRLDPLAAGADLLRLLDELQRDGRCLVAVVDDAQWADRQSLQALAFAIRRLRADRVLGIVVTRDIYGAEIPPGLRRLTETRDAGRVALDGLTAADVRELSEAMGCRGLSLSAARRLRAHTGGNPLHVRALLEEFPLEVLSDLDAPLPAPRSFALLVLARLARCGEAARLVVSAASVLGMKSALHVAARLAGVDDPLPAADEAIKAGLMRERLTCGGPVIEFPHPLIRAAVYHDLGPARRGALNRRAAELTESHEAGLRHRVYAATGPDPQLAAEVAAAARGQVAAGAWGNGGALFCQAARLTTEEGDRVRMYAEAVEALLFNGQVPEAAALIAQLPGTAGPAVQRYAAGQLAAVTGKVADAFCLLRSAWDGCGGEPWLAARIAGQLAKLHARQGAGAAAAEWAARALQYADGRPTGDLIHFTRLTGLALAGGADQALSLSADLPDPAVAGVAELDALLGRGLVRTWADDLAGAERDLAGVWAACGDRSVSFRLLAAAFLGHAEYRLGRWDQALIHADAATSIARDSGQAALISISAAVAVLVSAARGDWAGAAANLHTARGSAVQTGAISAHAYTAAAEAHLAAARGEPHRVITALRPLLGLNPGDGADEPGVLAWRDLLIDALIACGEHDEADVILTRYETLATTRGRRSVLAAASRVRGNLHAARRQHAAADAAYRAGLEHAATTTIPFDQARLHLAYGSFLRRASRRRAAAQHLHAARDTFAHLSAQPYLERCDRELAACGQIPRHSPARPAPAHELTPQEDAVTQLAATGMSNQQIARKLVLSVKTVEYHLSHAYTKLDVTSRTALAAAFAHGQTPSSPTPASKP